MEKISLTEEQTAALTEKAKEFNEYLAGLFQQKCDMVVLVHKDHGTGPCEGVIVLSDNPDATATMGIVSQAFRVMQTNFVASMVEAERNPKH